MATKDEKDYPGYPHYPANEDITRAGNNNGKLVIDETGTNDTDENKPLPSDTSTDADVTPDELDALTSTEYMDGNDTLRIKNSSLDSTDEDGLPLNEVSGLFTDNTRNALDVPGSEDDDLNEDIGEEDEENNYYSLGEDKEDIDQDNRD